MLLGAASLTVLMPVGYALAASETVLYSFESVGAAGYPKGGLIADGTGAFYGTTSQGGASYGRAGAGTVFKITPPAPGEKSWTESLIADLAGTYSRTPEGDMVMDADGALYGTAYGVSADTGSTHGSVFKLAPPADGQLSWTEKKVYQFDGSNGAYPQGTLLWGADGALYGTTSEGGGVGGGIGSGTVFKLTPPPAGQSAWWTETVLHRFGGPDGRDPVGGLIADASGALYGTVAGGAGTGCQCGAVFKLTPPAAGKTTWTERLLHSFKGSTDGSAPFGTLVADSSGALYGTTYEGGGTGCGGSGCGTVFRLTPLNVGKTIWHETVLYRFKGTNGAGPQGRLLPGTSGVFYGTTESGGSANAGTVFRLTPPAVGKISWSLSVLHNFTYSDGAFPTAGLIADAKGVLYGTTNGGGDKGLGTVFRVVP
jgi:uncharacterized repeat protein (TIGR03803 family)